MRVSKRVAGAGPLAAACLQLLRRSSALAGVRQLDRAAVTAAEEPGCPRSIASHHDVQSDVNGARQPEPHPLIAIRGLANE